MLIEPTPLYRPRRRVKPKPAVSPVPVPPVPVPPGPVLIGASFSREQQVVTLVFDREVNTDALVSADFVVDDSNGTPLRFSGSDGVFRPDGVTVGVVLQEDSAAQHGGVWLTVTPGNGIVSSEDGTAWVGESGAALPFGQG